RRRRRRSRWRAGSRRGEIEGAGAPLVSITPPSRDLGLSTASTRTFEAWLGHLAQVENLVELLLAHALGPRELPDRLARAYRFLGELGRLVVADHRVERRGQHRAALHQLRTSVGGLQAFDAALGEVAGRGSKKLDRLEGRDPGHRHHDVELEQAACLAADDD